MRTSEDHGRCDAALDIEARLVKPLLTLAVASPPKLEGDRFESATYHANEGGKLWAQL